MKNNIDEYTRLAAERKNYKGVMYDTFYMIAVQKRDGSLSRNTHGTLSMNGSNGPKALFPTYEEALEACEALIRQHPSSKFIILQSVELVESQVAPVKRTKF